VSLWAWVLIGLSAAGVLLALVSVVPVIIAALRLRKRMTTLRSNSVFLSTLGLQIQMNHLTHAVQGARPISERARVALASIRRSANEAGVPQARAAMQQTGANITALIDDLR
jgi:hypothetical protein